ncbi:maleylpyruvate isomerase family mycothiol-dependent enzyme [Nocardioides sp. AE5]|uniref:maleylpyruvate isomerase family mycothiol-dependent enzyme n=1 Tax=Nocardioides sp. AE5 TaxID=2962573 RepID=UPI002881F63B|nr:maleylpyruvate isomerase family mycothiol-dependent enzyme [Nocardioides sp. AE5]MDT0200722.1 maleylpyruvate isomerase family mycothiol-dependent enzyme [Nocardioides sp. AE5]
MTGHLTTAITAYRRFAAHASSADPTVDTRLAGWRVDDLVEHVTWGAAMEADALGAALGEAPGPAPAPDLPGAVAAFADVAARVAGANLDPESPVALPAGTVPMAYAAPLFAFEAALHASDLAHALGEDDTLGAAELAACAVVVGPMLDLLATGSPAEPTVIDLIGLGDPIRLSATGRAWRRSTPDSNPATTTIRGTAHQITLFACGRIGADDLHVDGDPGPARRFKEFFPGP